MVNGYKILLLVIASSLLTSATAWVSTHQSLLVVVRPRPQRIPSRITIQQQRSVSRNVIFHLQSSSSSDNNDESRAPMELPFDQETTTPSSLADNKKPSFAKRIQSIFQSPADGLSFKERLTKMGLAAVLSYGWVSNMSYSVTVSLAWYIFCKQSGLSPLAPGQWKGFLATYAGFWVMNNFLRPVRLALAVGVSPAFDRVIQRLQVKLNVNKTTAIVVTVLLANLVGTTVCMSAGILLASTLAGVPVFVVR